MMNIKDVIRKGFEELIIYGTKVENTRSNHGHGDSVNSEMFYEWSTSALSLLERVFGVKSIYYTNFVEKYKTFKGWANNFEHCRGILKAAKSDYENGYTDKLYELIQADMFSDFLEMAEYLLSEGYKDAAAVIIGSVLEEHLRKLCNKNSIDIHDSDGKPIKAERLNQELAKDEKVYTKKDQKNVTAWLDLRNKAAHGEYEKYIKEEVNLLLQHVKLFIDTYPA